MTDKEKQMVKEELQKLMNAISQDINDLEEASH
jgi:hypothetical protein